nr:hypothetical protein [Tanacetum cinerariifolium]
MSKASSLCAMSIFAVLKVGIPIFTGMTAFVPYVSENGVSPLLDLIIVRCAHKTCGISSIQSLLLSSSRAFIPFPKLLFAHSTKPLACGCLTETKSTDYVIPYKLLDLIAYDGYERLCFNLLYK